MFAKIAQNPHLHSIRLAFTGAIEGSRGGSRQAAWHADDRIIVIIIIILLSSKLT
jgi:hypothetical protein